MCWKGFGLFHCPAAGWANFSNLQTVWAPAQDSGAQGLVLQENQARQLISLTDMHHIRDHCSTDTFFFSKERKETSLPLSGLRELGDRRKREGERQQDEGSRPDEKDKWRKDLRSAVLKPSEKEKTSNTTAAPGK